MHFCVTTKSTLSTANPIVTAKGLFVKPFFYYVSFQLGSYSCVLSAKNWIAGRGNSTFSKYKSKIVHKNCPLKVILGKLYPEVKKTSQEWLCSAVNLKNMLVFLRECYSPIHGVKSVEKILWTSSNKPSLVTVNFLWHLGAILLSGVIVSVWSPCAKLKATPRLDLHCGSHQTVPLPIALEGLKSKVM